MIGIIYKFTILARYRMDGHKPFYIGQHWTNDIERFLRVNCGNYYGSGSIWNDFIDKMKKDYPKNWRKLLKREILFYSDKISPDALNKLEAYYIKREKSHYSYKLGGTNVLWEASTENSPMLNRKHKETSKIKMRNAKIGKSLSEVHKQNISKSINYFWNHISDEERKILVSKLTNKPNAMKGTKYITNGLIECRIKANDDIPVGWKLGRKPKSEETCRRISESQIKRWRRIKECV